MSTNGGHNGKAIHDLTFRILFAGLAVSMGISAIIFTHFNSEIVSMDERHDREICKVQRQAQVEQQHLREEMYLILNLHRERDELPVLIVPETDFINCN